MKKLTYREFEFRVSEIAKARKIFIPHFTTSITTAFELYQEVLASERLPLFISTMQANKTLSPLDDYIRPLCPECGRGLMLKVNAIDQNDKIWPSAWGCPSCLLDYYTEKTAAQWMKELELADHARK
jgi:hypothetical protein